MATSRAVLAERTKQRRNSKMLAIKFNFLTGGYHATTWGRHANDEAAAEWPPSPWRIVRALTSTWKQFLPDLQESDVSPIIEKLASERPKFHLPPAAVAHSRHYMPLGETERVRETGKEKEKVKLFFDIFVSTEKNARLYVVWDGVEIDERQRETLSTLLAAMPYLGRAETWIKASLVSSHPEPNCKPVESLGAGEGDWERIMVLAPSIRPDPERLLKAALSERSAIQRSGRILPEGVERARYARKRGILNTERAGASSSPKRAAAATVVRLSMTGDTHQPSVVDTLRWGDAAHKTAVRKSRKSGGASPALSGIDPRTDKPISDPKHPHAFYIPADEDGDGGLDTLTIWAPGGLSEDDVYALASMRDLYTRAREARVRLSYLGHGIASDFDGVSPLFCESSSWKSVTPYIPSRHLPRRGRYSVKKRAGWEKQARREIEERGCEWNLESVNFKRSADGARLTPLSQSGGNAPLAAQFFKHRANGARVNAAMTLTLEFSEAVRGPVAFGYGCHFGMGLFAPSG